MNRLMLLVSLGAMTLGVCLPGHAQTPTISGPPDVLVIVYQQPGGSDQVGITYAHLVPHAQVVQDLKALTQATGWPLSALTIKDAAAPVHSQFGPMTAAEFQVPGVVQDAAHTLPVETFARAFHQYKRLNLVFFVGPQFQFQGSTSSADNDIKVSLDQHGTAYAYQIEILNPNFAHLPPVQPPGGVQAAGHRTPWGIFAGILGAAALAGLVVYLLTSRLTPPPGPRPEVRQDDSETRQEVGSKG